MIQEKKSQVNNKKACTGAELQVQAKNTDLLYHETVKFERGIL